MNSSDDDRCSHRPGFPIRTSPDHGLLASPRGLSQLATSFIAFLRLGIHTHALSSLTIKFAVDTVNWRYQAHSHRSRFPALHPSALLVVLILPVNIQFSKIAIASAINFASSTPEGTKLMADCLRFGGPG